MLENKKSKTKHQDCKYLLNEGESLNALNDNCCAWVNENGLKKAGVDVENHCGKPPGNC